MQQIGEGNASPKVLTGPRLTNEETTGLLEALIMSHKVVFTQNYKM